jgi:hypothetical protein
LGPGALDDFLQIDPASIRFTDPVNVMPQPGHVYLLDQRALKHWVLLQFALEPEAPR